MDGLNILNPWIFFLSKPLKYISLWYSVCYFPILCSLSESIIHPSSSGFHSLFPPFLGHNWDSFFNFPLWTCQGFHSIFAPGWMKWSDFRNFLTLSFFFFFYLWNGNALPQGLLLVFHLISAEWYLRCLNPCPMGEGAIYKEFYNFLQNLDKLWMLAGLTVIS